MPAHRLTVAVLNHDYAHYVGAAIDSALAQTHDDVEVVVVDDGSTDDSLDVIRSYGDRVVLHAKPNGGQGSAMNAALAAATGDVVIFLDADDLLAPEVGARVMARFAADPQLAWVMYRLRIVDGDGRPTDRVRPRRPGVMPDGDLRRHLARYRCFHWQPTSGNAFATDALRAVGPVPEDDYRISADAYLAGVVPWRGTVGSLDEVGGSYRLHGSSNFSARAADAAWFRDQLARQRRTHQHARRVAAEAGTTLPADPGAALDVAHLTFRLASLVLDPDAHPEAADRRWRLVGRGVVAALANRRIAWPGRLRRAAWLVACGLAPRRLAVRVAAAAPDTPGRRQRFLASAAA